MMKVKIDDSVSVHNLMEQFVLLFVAATQQDKQDLEQVQLMQTAALGALVMSNALILDELRALNKLMITVQAVYREGAIQARKEEILNEQVIKETKKGKLN